MTESGYHKWIRTRCECVKCHAPEAEVCHYSGLYSSMLGHGMGKKCWFHVCAALCRNCHVKFDSYAGGNTEQRAIEFMLAIFETQRRYLDETRTNRN